eukprot:TRINITY_DN3593_c0_g1_i1.p1 TRINITY_DN3593_c0_g1~~TRINITY_DN3593_c0_g1_i1.p1  ORF type:complete len:145 (+),score=24.05 TRINITY_DN3593_c0_g1_i1:73-507(+)
MHHEGRRSFGRSAGPRAPAVSAAEPLLPEVAATARAADLDAEAAQLTLLLKDLDERQAAIELERYKLSTRARRVQNSVNAPLPLPPPPAPAQPRPRPARRPHVPSDDSEPRGEATAAAVEFFSAMVPLTVVYVVYRRVTAAASG